MRHSNSRGPSASSGSTRRQVIEATHRAWILLEKSREVRARAIGKAVRKLPAKDRELLTRAVAIMERLVVTSEPDSPSI